MTQIALVGAGFMGQFHAQAVASSDVAELAAVVDTNPAAKEVADSYGVRYLASVDEALEADGIDAFIVALPDRAHVEVASRLLGAGRHVLLEKPMADTLEGAKQIARAARDGGGRLLVGHVLRHDPRYVAAAEAVADGQIGDVLHLSSGRLAIQGLGERMNGSSSVLFYLGVHDADLVQWLSGRSIESVYARAGDKLMRSRGVDSEDVIVTTCELEDGLVAQLYAGWTLRDDTPSPVNAHTMVVGTDGAIEIDVRDHGLRMHNGGGFQLPDALHWPGLRGRLIGDLLEEVGHFARSIGRDEPFVMTVDEALRAVAVNDAILRSVESGRPEKVEAWSID